jgi:hypothetical protein
VRPQFREATGAGRSAEAVAYYQEPPGRRIGRQAADQERGSKDCRQRGEAAGVAEKVLEPPLPAATLNLQGCDVGHTLRSLPKLPIICDPLIGVGVAMCGVQAPFVTTLAHRKLLKPLFAFCLLCWDQPIVLVKSHRY